MIKKNILLLSVGILMLSAFILTVSSSDDYGHIGAEYAEEFTLEKMLAYAIEDEYLAYAEYELIINELGAGRPFTNIIKAEATHIEELEALYDTYDLEIPEVDPSVLVVLPASIEVALTTGIEAEINNIEMYDKFLAQDLPADVREVFEELQAGSENHLAAFSRERGLNGTSGERKGVNGEESNRRQTKGNDKNASKGNGQGSNSETNLWDKIMSFFGKSSNNEEHNSDCEE